MLTWRHTRAQLKQQRLSTMTVSQPGRVIQMRFWVGLSGRTVQLGRAPNDTVDLIVWWTAPLDLPIFHRKSWSKVTYSTRSGTVIWNVLHRHHCHLWSVKQQVRSHVHFNYLDLHFYFYDIRDLHVDCEQHNRERHQTWKWKMLLKVKKAKNLVENAKELINTLINASM